MTPISLIAGHVQPTRVRWRRDDHVGAADKSNSSPFEARRAAIDRRHRHVPVAVDRRGRRQGTTTPQPLEAKFVAQVIAQAYGLNQNPTAAQTYARCNNAEDLTHQVTVI
jgi:hypothetical protein